MVSKGYKVVNKDLRSFRDGIGSVTYKVGEWVTPLYRHGPLAVFDSLGAARILLVNCTSHPEDFVIYSCDFEPSKCETLWMYPVRNTRTPLCFLPAGSILAKRVMIKEEVGND